MGRISVYTGIIFYFFLNTVSGQSILSSGKWLKAEIQKHGVYRITYNDFRNNGINPSSINPEEIRVFGFGNGMLEQSNAVPAKILGDHEIAVELVGMEDGSFDRNDLVLFYAQGPDRIEARADRRLIGFQTNRYANQTNYFISVGNGNGKRLEVQPDLGSGFPQISHGDHFVHHEIDRSNIVKSGREWYGERFEFTLSATFQHPIPGLRPNSDVTVISSVMGQTERHASSFDLSINGIALGRQDLPSIGSGEYDAKGAVRIDTFSLNNLTLNDQINLGLVFNRSDQTNETAGYLDYYTISYQQNLFLENEQVLFRSFESLDQARTEYVIESEPELKCWDITDPLNTLQQQFRTESGTIRFSTDSDILHEFALFTINSTLRPSSFTSVDNQDLLSRGMSELVIIAAEELLSEAERLASFRQTHDGLSAEVVSVDEIYHEFSSGAQDVTAIRNFIRVARENGSQIRYLLLFGDCSYDYKDFVPDNINLVPTYESRNSLHPIYSYSSDDYFGFLDPDEGEWIENTGGDHLLDLGIGRLPLETLEEAQTVVDKLIHYSENADYGDWRNSIYFVADDGDANLHHRDADLLSRSVDAEFPSFNVRKIYLDAYRQDSVGLNSEGEVEESSEEARQAITDAINKGAFLVNYTGHGGETGWTEEDILDNPTIESWENLDRLPLFMTATCEFGRYDDTNRRSGGELLILNPRGGAIALLTTTRPVFASSNQLVNGAFYDIILKKENGQYPRLGDVMRFTKNNSLNGRVNRNFVLLGDPSMRMQYPENDMRIDEINNQPAALNDTLSALNKVSIGGYVERDGGQIMQDFNGTATVTVFEKPIQRETLGTRNPVFRYRDRNVILFRGEVEVKNGRYSAEFVVPTEILPEYGSGKVSLYGLSSNGRSDANGSSFDIVVGGSNPNPPQDNTPPEISLFMNDTTFENGGITRPDTRLLIRLSDENGIHLSSLSGNNNITASLDGEPEVILNDTYKADLNSYTSGFATWNLFNLEPGLHTISVKASDTYGNSNIASIDFQVTEGEALVIKKVFNYPNPANNYTNFAFQHNRAGDDLDVTIQVINTLGSLVDELKVTVPDSPTQVRDIWWDTAGDKKTGQGVYIYRIIIRSLVDSSTDQKAGKLVIIN